MTTQEKQEKLQELNHDITLAMDQCMEKSFEIVKNYRMQGEMCRNHEPIPPDAPKISKVENMIALYDLASLCAVSIQSQIAALIETQTKFAAMFGQPKTADPNISLLETLKNNLEKIISDYLAPDSRVVYDMCLMAFEGKKDVKIDGNPSCATDFFAIATQKFDEMEKVEKEVTSD